MKDYPWLACIIYETSKVVLARRDRRKTQNSSREVKELSLARAYGRQTTFYISGSQTLVIAYSYGKQQRKSKGATHG